jgi:hypothetical protein
MNKGQHTLIKLLAEEQQKQKDAGDPVWWLKAKCGANNNGWATGSSGHLQRTGRIATREGETVSD